MSGEIDGVPLSKLVDTFTKIRDARTELKKKFEVADKGYEEQQLYIKRELLSYCKDQGVESMRTEAGTFYRKLRTRYWTSDWAAMHRFVLDNEVPELLEKRINQTEIKNLMAEQPELVPPGLNTDSEYTLSIRKSK